MRQTTMRAACVEGFASLTLIYGFGHSLGGLGFGVARGLCTRKRCREAQRSHILTRLVETCKRFGTLSGNGGARTADGNLIARDLQTAHINVEQSNFTVIMRFAVHIVADHRCVENGGLAVDLQTRV